MGTYKDPLPGWLDVDNFLTLYCKGVRMGVLRLIPASMDTAIEMIPLDLCVRGILVSTWKRSVHPTKETEVYCHRLTDEYRLRMEDLKTCSFELSENLAMPNTLWYNFVFFADNLKLYGLLFFFLHVIPGFFLDELLKFKGQKPRLKKVYTYIWRYNSLAFYYAKPHHRFLSDNFNRLDSYLPKEDKDEFSLDFSEFDKMKNLEDMTLSVMRYSWKENVFDKEVLDKSRKRYRMLTILHYSLCFLAFFFVVKTLWPLIRSPIDERIRMDDPAQIALRRSL